MYISYEDRSRCAHLSYSGSRVLAKYGRLLAMRSLEYGMILAVGQFLWTTCCPFGPSGTSSHQAQYVSLFGQSTEIVNFSLLRTFFFMLFTPPVVVMGVVKFAQMLFTV